MQRMLATYHHQILHGCGRKDQCHNEVGSCISVMMCGREQHANVFPVCVYLSSVCDTALQDGCARRLAAHRPQQGRRAGHDVAD